MRDVTGQEEEVFEPMTTPTEWYDAAKRYMEQRRIEERKQHQKEQQTTLVYLIDPSELCADCAEKVMRPA